MTEQQSSAIDALLSGKATFADVVLPDIRQDERYQAFLAAIMSINSVGEIARFTFELAHEAIQRLFPGVPLAQWKNDGTWLGYHNDSDFRWMRILLHSKATTFVATMTFFGQRRADESMFAHDLDALLPRVAVCVGIPLAELLDMQGSVLIAEKDPDGSHQDIAHELNSRL